jgi:hypothetical protein
MTKLAWDLTGQRQYETGVNHGVLYPLDDDGAYSEGFAWNGLTAVTESPSGAEATPLYADNIKYLNLTSYEEFAATIEAYTYPDEFAECDGSAQPETGVFLGQQRRRTFGFVWRTLVGNDVLGNDFGYKLHLLYGGIAAPSEKANATVNDTPEAITFSWEVSTTPVEVGVIAGVTYKPTSYMCVSSVTADAGALAELEDLLFGTPGSDPELPLPAAVIALFAGTTTTVTPAAPTYVSGTHTITIPSVTGVIYKINGVTKVAGPVVITEDTVVNAVPAAGYRFPPVSDDDWFFDFV